MFTVETEYFLSPRQASVGENCFMMPLKHCSENNHTLHKVTEGSRIQFRSNSLMATGKCWRIIIFRSFPSWSFVVLSFSTNLYFSLLYSSFMWMEPITSHSNDDGSSLIKELFLMEMWKHFGLGGWKEEKKNKFHFLFDVIRMVDTNLRHQRTLKQMPTKLVNNLIYVVVRYEWDSSYLRVQSKLFEFKWKWMDIFRSNTCTHSKGLILTFSSWLNADYWTHYLNMYKLIRYVHHRLMLDLSLCLCQSTWQMVFRFQYCVFHTMALKTVARNAGWKGSEVANIGKWWR